MSISKERIRKRRRRIFSIRKKIKGTTERPRLCVRRSLKHISAQIFDDDKNESLVQVTSASKEFAGIKGTKTDVAKAVGEKIAELAAEKGIKKVVFDRRGFPYHGRVKALAEGARSKGLEF